MCVFASMQELEMCFSSVFKWSISYEINLVSYDQDLKNRIESRGCRIIKGNTVLYTESLYEIHL